ncbi:MAG: hypothetical protein ACF8MF_02305 [Phycisphaerales bacterium JB052]
MSTPRHTTISLSIATLLAISGCGGGSDSSSKDTVAPDYEPDTSYLDGLAEDQGIESQPEPEPVEIDQTRIEDTTMAAEDEAREWVKEDGSKSIFGRSRDKGIDTTNRIQGGTEPENGIANTTYDEEYAQAAGHAWDMPEGWRMAVPSSGHFAEMYIQHPLGNASVIFSKTTETAAQTRRTLESYITDTFGSSDTRTSTKTIMGYPVTVYDLEGTYIDPAGKGGRNESPFYAIHAVMIELPTAKVLIRMWGPQDTVNQNKGKFDAMIEKMYEK